MNPCLHAQEILHVAIQATHAALQTCEPGSTEAKVLQGLLRAYEQKRVSGLRDDELARVVRITRRLLGRGGTTLPDLPSSLAS